MTKRDGCAQLDPAINKDRDTDDEDDEETKKRNTPHRIASNQAAHGDRDKASHGSGGNIMTRAWIWTVTLTKTRNWHQL